MAEYHEAFWVAVAAAGPVIALAHVIAAGQSLEDFHKGADERPKANLSRWIRGGQLPRRPRLPFRGGKVETRAVVATLIVISPYVCALLGFIVAAVVTTDALDCLGAKHDMYTRGSIKLGVAVSLAFAVLQVLVRFFILNAFSWRRSEGDRPLPYP